MFPVFKRTHCFLICFTVRVRICALKFHLLCCKISFNVIHSLVYIFSLGICRYTSLELNTTVFFLASSVFVVFYLCVIIGRNSSQHRWCLLFQQSTSVCTKHCCITYYKFKCLLHINFFALPSFLSVSVTGWSNVISVRSSVLKWPHLCLNIFLLILNFGCKQKHLLVF